MLSSPPDFPGSRSQSSECSAGSRAFPGCCPPSHASARMRNVAFGHAIGLAAGLLAVYLTRAAYEPAVTDMVKDTLSLDRVAASVIAVVLSLAVQHRLNLVHPPAEAT